MSYQLTQKLRDLTPYDPIQGEYAIRLDANESFLRLDHLASKEIARSLEEVALNRYPDPYAVNLCRRFGAFYNVNPDLMTAGNGSDELIGILIGCFLEKGDKILTLAPDFSMYRFYGDLYENQVLMLQKKPDLTIEVDQVIETVNREQIGMVLFSNPCNPTSIGLEIPQVKRLIQSVNALVVLDEAYMDFYDQSLLPWVEDYDNLVILRTCSKAIGLAGIRLGFAVANSKLTRAIKAAKSPYNVNTLTQTVGEIVLRDPEILREGIRQIIASREELYHMLTALCTVKRSIKRVIRPDTNFVFLELEDAPGAYRALLDRSIAVRQMGSFLRITAGTVEENAAVAKALDEILKED